MLANILADLIANGVTSVLRAISGTRPQMLESRAITARIPHRARLLPTLQRGAATAARKFNTEDRKYADRIKMFLSSPEAESVVRQLFSTRLMRLGDDKLLNRIHSEFRAHFKAFVSSPPERGQPANPDDIFSVLVQGCEEALQLAIDDGSLATHEAMSAARFHVIHTELGAIRTSFDAVFSRHDLLRRANEFEEKYRRQVAERHRWIVLPHLHTMHRVRSTSLFVPPLLRFGQAADTLTLEQFWSTLSRAVVIGNPGAGKSTLLEYTAMQVASRYPERLVANRQLTPVVINVGEYALAARRDALTVAQFVEQRAISRYQLSVPKGAIEYLFETGRGIALFDGLDEVVDVARRGEVCASIEAFCALYPSVPTVVTSREVGYHHAPLRADLFIDFRIEPFDDERISDFARKWFLLSLEEDPAEAEKFSHSLVRETATAAPDLRTNPLMLGLICNLYRSEGYIPEHRAEVYEKCAMLLYEQWDRRRNLPTLAFETRLRPVVASLAHWIYTEPPPRGGVTESDLVRRVATIIAPTKRNETEKREAAQQFVEFCKGRAWVFTDIGADTETPLYQFTHRTFLEYFTAVHLVGTTQTVDELLSLVLPRVERGEWDLVARMAFQIKARQTFTATDELLTKTLARSAILNPLLSSRLLLFCVGTLEGLVPRVEVTKEIAEQLVNSAVMSAVMANASFDGVPAAVVATNEDVRATLTKAVVGALASELVRSGPASSGAHAVICAWAKVLLRLAPAGQLTRDGAKFFESLRGVVASNELRCEAIWRSELRALVAAFVAHCCGAGIMIRYHGLASLLKEYHTATDGEAFSVVPLVSLYADDLADSSDPWFVSSLESVADAFGRLKLPVFKSFSPADPAALVRSLHEQRRFLLSSDASPAARFGAFIIAAVLTEWFVEHLHLGPPPRVGQPLTAIVRARYGGSSHDGVEGAKSLDLSAPETSLIRKWLAAEVDFIEKPRTAGQGSASRGRGGPKRKRKR